MDQLYKKAPAKMFDWFLNFFGKRCKPVPDDIFLLKWLHI